MLVLLVIVAAAVLAIWQPWRGSSAPVPSAVTPSATPTSPAATSSAPATETPTVTDAADAAPPEASPSPSGEAIAACTTGDISVLAITDKDSYAAGEQPQLSISLSNTSSSPCLINVGTAKQAFVITSGSDTWWRSTDCQSEPTDQVVQLAAGQTVTSVTPLVWDRTRSSADSCGSTTRPAASPGFYHLQVSIGGIEGADTRMFELQ